MDLLYQVLILILTPTSVLAILVYISKKFFESAISKDLEEFKNQLKIQTAEHQIRYSYIHEKRARIYSEFYTFLVRTIRAVEDLVRPIRTNDPFLADQRSLTANNYNQTSSHFAENRLFFEPEDIERIEGILTDIKESIIEFNIAQPGNEIEHGPNNDPQLWIASYRRIKDNVKPVLTDIENRFRDFFQTI